jgi:deoxyribonuclease V
VLVFRAETGEPEFEGKMLIGVVDVHYAGDGATAACVMLEAWDAETAVLESTADIERVLPYESGNFYRRELPCITTVLGRLARVPDIVVIDGYVWLGEESRPGLGAHLHEALGGEVAIVGVAKSFYPFGEKVTEVRRGQSQRPLYVSAVGVDLSAAGDWVRTMHGENRIPTALHRADRLCRQGADGRGTL